MAVARLLTLVALRFVKVVWALTRRLGGGLDLKPKPLCLPLCRIATFAALSAHAAKPLHNNRCTLNIASDGAVMASDIKSRKPSPFSLMPTGLINTMNPDEVLDLLAYLISDGDPKNAAFR